MEKRIKKRLQTNFKNMNDFDLLKHFEERKNELDEIESEIDFLKTKLNLLANKKQRIKERFGTVNLWVKARKLKHK